MNLQFDTKKLNTLFNGVMEDKLDIENEAKVKAYLNKVFGSRTPSIHELHQFNEVVVEQAEVIYQKKATNILEILADVVRKPEGSIYEYTIPVKHNANWVWSGNGTSVEHVRVGHNDTRLLAPTKISTGLYYEMDALAQADVAYFKELVNLVADAKIQMYFSKLSELMQAAVADGRIPTGNVLTGTNITLNQYTKLAAKFTRSGGRPVFVADAALIDHFAQGQTTDVYYKELLYPELQRSLVEDLSITKIGRTTAVNLINPYIVGSGNTKTELPVNEGYMFAAGALKPFKLVEFGEMKQFTEFDSDLEQVQIKLTQKFAVDFIQGEMIGFVQDDSITI